MPEEARLQPASLRGGGRFWRPRLRSLVRPPAARRSRKGLHRLTLAGATRLEIWLPTLAAVLARRSRSRSVTERVIERVERSPSWEQSPGSPAGRMTVINITAAVGRALVRRDLAVSASGEPTARLVPTSVLTSSNPSLLRVERFRRVETIGFAVPERAPVALAGPIGPAGPTGQSLPGSMTMVTRRVPSPTPTAVKSPSAVPVEAPPATIATFPPALPTPTLPSLDEITTQVIRRIERRAVAQRERLARG